MATPRDTCPRCQVQPGHPIAAPSLSLWVESFRCPSCGAVWNVPRDRPVRSIVPPTHAIPSCPACHQSPVRLLDRSQDAWVNSFCCDACHHTWHVPKTSAERGLAQDPVTRIGRVTYEHRFVIVHVPADWRRSDPLPTPSPADLWFDTRADFEAALEGPWDQQPINRRPAGEEPSSRPDANGERR
jgi:transposase-like protein